MISERQFSGLLAKIYEAAADFGRWPDALRGIAEAHNAPTAVFGAYEASGREVSHIAPGVDSRDAERYANYYHRINPIWRVAMPSRVGAVMTDEMMIEKRAFVRTEFYNDFLTPLDVGSMLGATLLSDDGVHCAIAVQRRRRFGAASIALQRRLAPHLARAVQLNLRLSELDRRATANAEALDQLCQGAILVDAEARVLFANPAAERLIGPLGCLRIEGGALATPSASATMKLRALIAGCGASLETEAGGELSLTRVSDGRALSAIVSPLRSEAPAFFLLPRPAAIVFVSDPDRAAANLPARLRRRFGLTAAEAAFAIEIAKGDGLQASADRLGVSLSTARTHLARVFEKTEVRRQAELARLIASSP